MALGSLPWDSHLRPAHHLLLSYGLTSESVLLPFLGAVGLGMPFPSSPVTQLDSCPLGNRRQEKGISKENKQLSLCADAINATF